MERVEHGRSRVGVVVAVALIAHLWMLHPGPPPAVAAATPPGPAVTAPATPPLMGVCALGMPGCRALAPAERPEVPGSAVVLLVLPWLLLGAARPVAGRRGRPRAWSPERCPPRSCVPASVVLRQ